MRAPGVQHGVVLLHSHAIGDELLTCQCVTADNPARLVGGSVQPLDQVVDALGVGRSLTAVLRVEEQVLVAGVQPVLAGVLKAAR